MSTTYPDLQNKFPDSIDPMRRFQDVSIATKPLVDRFNAFVKTGDFASASNLIRDNPILKDVIINADNMQYWYDMVISIERFYFNDFQNYLVNAFIYRGDWSSSTKYNKFDLVRYNGVIYMAISGSIPTGVVPTNTTYWVMLSAKGDQGASGLGMSPRGTWNSSTQYYQYDVVTWDNKLWYAKRDNRSSQPFVGSNDWEVALDIRHTGGTTSSAVTKVSNTSVITVDVICADSLTSTATNIPLSANQGRKLNVEKAPLASPTFTGTPKAPTPNSTAADNVIATVGYVKASGGGIQWESVSKSVEANKIVQRDAGGKIAGDITGSANYATTAGRATTAGSADTASAAYAAQTSTTQVVPNNSRAIATTEYVTNFINHMTTIAKTDGKLVSWGAVELGNVANTIPIRNATGSIITNLAGYADYAHYMAAHNSGSTIRMWSEVTAPTTVELKNNASDSKIIFSHGNIRLFPYPAETVTVTGFINPSTNTSGQGVNWCVGHWDWRWYGIYLHTSPNVSSDSQFKEDIKKLYFKVEAAEETPQVRLLGTETSDQEVYLDDVLSMNKYIADNLYTYKYKNNDDEDNIHLGVLADKINDHKLFNYIGSNNADSNNTSSLKSMNLSFLSIFASSYALERIETLETRIAELEGIINDSTNS